MTAADPTDRDKAAALVHGLSPEHAYVDEFLYDGEVQPLIDAIAQALADERSAAKELNR